MPKIVAPRFSITPLKSNSGSPSFPVFKFKPNVEEGLRVSSSEPKLLRKREYPKRTSFTCVGPNTDSQLPEVTCTRVGDFCAKAPMREPLPKPPTDPSGKI